MPIEAPPRKLLDPSTRLGTVHAVETILHSVFRDDEGPLTLAQIRRRLNRGRVRAITVRTGVDELKRRHLVVGDPKRGVMWIPFVDPKVWGRRRFIRL